jgi:hypothetical protein
MNLLDDPVDFQDYLNPREIAETNRRMAATIAGHHQTEHSRREKQKKYAKERYARIKAAIQTSVSWYGG